MTTHFQVHNSDFIPTGVNWFSIVGGNLVSYDIGVYNAATMDAVYRTITSFGYNTVRLGTWPLSSGNPSGAGLSSGYMDNLADGIKRAAAHGLMVILDIAGIALNGGYRTGIPALYQDDTFAQAWIYLTSAGLTARNTYLADVLTALASRGVTPAMLLAIELTGEVGFSTANYPLSVHSGSVVTRAASYDMGITAQRTAMQVDNIVPYVNSQVTTVQGHATFGAVKTMIQLAPDYVTLVSTSDRSLTNNAILTSGTMDSIGHSLYPTFDDSLPTLLGTYGMPLPAGKIHTILETGWLVTHAGTLTDMTNATVRWLALAASLGVSGFSWFNWDVDVVDSSGYYPMTAGDYTFALALSPSRIGDGSGPLPTALSFNAPTPQPFVSHDLFLLDINGNPANTINGQPVFGALAGWKGLSYSPTGAAIDKVPQNTVSIPLSDWRNIAVDTGVQVLVRDTSVSDDPTHGEVTRGPVLDVDQSVDDKGVHWATLAFADELYELSRADVTSGFATSQGETLSVTQTRLLSLADTTWTGINDVTGLDGVAFTATGSIAQAFDKLRQERFAHFRREQIVTAGIINPRIFHLAPFGTPWLVNGQPVWFVEPGANVTAAAQNPNQRQIFAPQFKKRGEIVNSYTPTGGGNGVSQLTLRSLYGNTTFQGYNPAYPIQQRVQQAGSTSDGFDYFVEDAASIAVHGRTRGPLAKPDISAVVNTAGGVSAVDEVAAAVALYTVTVAQLKLTAKPVYEITFTTPGVGDVRMCGGMTAHVRFAGYAFDPQRQVYQFLNLDDDYTILDCVRAVNDATGATMDTFTLSNTGQAAATTGGTLLGVMDTVTAMHAGVQVYPFGRLIPKSQNIGQGADLIVNIPADNSVVRRHWALVYLHLEGMVHTRNDLGHTQDVVTGPITHDVNPLPHDVNAVQHDLAAHGDWSFLVAGIPTLNGQVVYDPKTAFHISTGTPPGSAQNVVSDGTHFWLADGSHGGKDLSLSSLALSIVQANPTTGGTGGKLVPTTGAATGTGATGGTVAKTTGGKGGATLQKTHAASSGLGARSAIATIEQVYRGPAPTGVTVLVDNVQRFGPFNTSPGVLDIIAWVSDQNAHTVTVRSPTNGAADVVIDVRDDVSTFAIKPS